MRASTGSVIAYISDRSEPEWLQRLLERAVAERWCTNFYCTTCGSFQLSISLGIAEWDEQKHYRRRHLTEDEAKEILTGLKNCRSPTGGSWEFEQAARWVLLRLWNQFGDEAHARLFPDLEGTWSGEVLASMRQHYKAKLERRRLQEARQGVKKRDWKE